MTWVDKTGRGEGIWGICDGEDFGRGVCDGVCWGGYFEGEVYGDVGGVFGCAFLFFLF